MTTISRAGSRTDRGSAGTTVTRHVDLPLTVGLENGATLPFVRIAYEAYGKLSPAGDNVVLVCHALSGDAHAAGISADGDAFSAVDGIGADERGIRPRGGVGWWDNLIGPGKAFDTDRYHVICTNILGSCRGSTGPSSLDPRTGQPYGSSFPVITVGDMVDVQRLALQALGIHRLLAVAGGSLGGMQALEWAIRYPEAVAGCIMTASTARLNSRGVAWNAIARNAITADPDWHNGDYYATGRFPVEGIKLARMVGHVTYLSAASMNEKFGTRLQNRDSYSYTLTEPDFAVESYLRHQAATFAERFDANSYLYISRALTYFDPAFTRGHGSLARAIQDVQASFLLLSFTSDWLYPSQDSQDLHLALRQSGKDADHHIIDFPYGHDSFLLEDAVQAGHISNYLHRLSNDAKQADLRDAEKGVSS